MSVGEILDTTLLQHLWSEDAGKRTEAAQELCREVIEAVADKKGADRNTLYAELNGQLITLLKSTSGVPDKLAGVAILAALADIATLDDAQKLRVSQQVKALLANPNPTISAEAVHIYRKLVQGRWPTVMNSIETEVNRCLEWLGSESHEVRQMTALRIIKTLCQRRLSLLQSYIYKILKSLGEPLRDRRLEMRRLAGRTLGACLSLVPLNDRNVRNPWLNFLFEELQRGNQMGSIEGYHSALLICHELLEYGGMYMQAHFAPVCDMALKLKDHRDPVVHQRAIALLPILARYSPQEFTRVGGGGGGESLLGKTCNYLITLSRASDRDSDRATAFLALGNIAQYCSAEFRSFLEPTTRAIRDALVQRAKMRLVPAETDETMTAVLQTISTLATALGPALMRYIRDILDLMFTVGLSQALCDSLLVLEREVGQLQPAIQGRLLDMVSIILVDIPFRPAQQSLDDLERRMGSVSLHYTTTASGGSGGGSSGGQNGTAVSNTMAATGESTSLVAKAAHNIPVTADTLVLALRTLRMFDFSEENLSEFVRNDILQYLSHSSAAVRKEAIHAVSHIVLSDPLYRSMAGAGVEVASEVVQRLVSAAVIDIDRDVRLMAVQMLERGSCFDFHMGKAQNIQDLFLLLNDEVFEVRLGVLAVIGRLTSMNPAHVMPLLRRMVVQLLTELEHARSNREREECIQLLMVLVRAAENWVRPYVGDIFRTILPRIDDAPASLASKLLDTVAALARVGGSDLVPHLDPLLASIMHALSDTANVGKRMSALKALSSCASFCSMVIDPYTEYPQLFAILTGILKSRPDSEMQQETMRAIGALGAIDPHWFNDANGNAPGSGSTAGEGGSASNSAGGGTAGSSGAAGGHNASAGTISSTAAAGKKADTKRKKKKKKKQQHKGERWQRQQQLNVMTVFNNEKPLESMIGDIPVETYGRTFSDDNYYTTVSVNALLRILNDTSDRTFHQEAAQALDRMFALRQSLFSVYLDRVIPAILRVMETAPTGGTEFYIPILGRLVLIGRDLIRPYLDPLFKLFKADELGSEREQTASIGLMEVISESLTGDFGPHIATVLPYLISVIAQDASEQQQPTLRALPALQILSLSLEGYLFLVMPRLIKLLDVATTRINVVKAALRCISSIVAAVNCSSFASRIVLTLVRLMQCSPTKELQTAVVDVLCTLMEQLQDEFTLFMPTISAAMKKRKIVDHARYERYAQLLFSGKLVQKEPSKKGSVTQTTPTPLPSRPDDGFAQLEMDILQLRQSWSAKNHKSVRGWMQWLSGFKSKLFQQSPSPALRACSALADKYPRLSNELFNAAFVSCWTVLPGQYQQEIITSLQTVASAPEAPSDILQTILGLAGYMERDEKQIPIDLKLLGEYADRCHALAKELHYKEAEWTLEKNYDTIKKLIELNQNLDLHDSAIGMLDYVRKEQPDIQESVEWYTRLQRWDKALELFRRQEAEVGPSHINTSGQIRCLFEMSDWETLVPMYERIWSGSDEQLKMMSASIGMSMSWAMGDIDRMEFYLSTLPHKSRDKSFCKALLAVYRNNFDEAARYISDAREEIEPDLVSHITESYSRGYSQVFQCQMLTELEEVVVYKKAHDDHERQSAIVNAWRERLDGIQQDVGMWQKVLRLRSMVLRPAMDLDTWIKYVNMSRKSGQMRIARDAITQMLDDEAQYLEEVNRGEYEVVSAKAVAQAQEYARVKSHMAQHHQGQPPVLPGGLVLPQGRQSSWEGRMRRFGGHASSGDSNAQLDLAIRLSQQPALVYMYLKYKWAAGERREAFEMLEMFATDYATRIGFDVRNQNAFAERIDARVLADLSGHGDAADEARITHLLARFYFKQAEWLSNAQQSASLAQEARAKAGLGPSDALYSQRMARRESIGVRRGRASMSAGNVDGAASEDGRAKQDAQYLCSLKGERINGTILESYRAATVLDRKWYKAWHSLALRHYHESQRYPTDQHSMSDDVIERHVVPAVRGFFRAIQLSKSDTTLQDTLRLLTVWFNYSQYESVAQAVQEGFNSVSIRTWLQVLPQILARVYIKSESTRRLIRQLLVEVGKSHPHAILFPLYVAARSDHYERSQAAKDVLARLFEFYPELVEETEVVSRELIRITELLPQMWTGLLNHVFRCPGGQYDSMQIAMLLKPLHKRTRNPETQHEFDFARMFGADLAVAEDLVMEYNFKDPRLRKADLLNQAYGIYANVYNRIFGRIPKPASIELKRAAPVLLQCRDMSLGVPGTYDPDREIIRISSFEPDVYVYSSQRSPRRIHINGSDGVSYRFLLKGHDDLRQDERAMQLFGLINSLLSRDHETAKRSLAIERFPVVPLSFNSGLIGFYPNCKSINKIVHRQRNTNHQALDREQRMAFQFSPNWATLTLMQKVESFEYALANTSGDDLQREMWYGSPNAEVWLERRTNYTRSLAVMSIAGYILGLGDRHPSNIMIHEWTGKVVHIDLGDCFEITMHRKEYPETIPFRLTRMMIVPMEVGSIEGIYKHTAKHTMRVLRANRDSLMAVLEAFVFDPLASWRYIHGSDDNYNSGSIDSLSMGIGASESNQAYYDITNGDGWRIGNPKGQAIVQHVNNKLTGTDFHPNRVLSVAEQVEKLIRQATAPDNLVGLYVGWVPFW